MYFKWPYRNCTFRCIEFTNFSFFNALFVLHKSFERIFTVSYAQRWDEIIMILREINLFIACLIFEIPTFTATEARIVFRLRPVIRLSTWKCCSLLMHYDSGRISTMRSKKTKIKEEQTNYEETICVNRELPANSIISSAFSYFHRQWNDTLQGLNTSGNVIWFLWRFLKI
jgi:hypothetical protein